MRINPGVHNLHQTLSTPPAAAANAASTTAATSASSADTATSTASASGAAVSVPAARVSAQAARLADMQAQSAPVVKKVDFHNMTSEQLHEWVNQEARSGGMSAQDAAAFSSLDSSAGANASGQPLDYMAKASSGLQQANSTHDAATQKRLETVLSHMQKSQGKTIGVDIRV